MHAVEIDETKFGAEIYKQQGHCDEFKWIFGMICRKTKVMILDYVLNKKSHNLKALIKRYVLEGTILYSDDAAMYTERKGVRSHLCEMGYFHFWVNHTKEVRLISYLFSFSTQTRNFHSYALLRLNTHGDT